MPELTIYRQAEFPAIYKWQVIAFMRCEWSAIFQGDNLYMPETYPPELEPVHFVIAEGDTLLSYAAVLKLNIVHAAHDYRVYGFGNMLTFPPFRRRGYGSQILQAANEFIQNGDVDTAILFCDPGLASFYGAHGWIASRSPTRLGTIDHYEEYVPLRMMQFVSQKGRQNKADFETQPVYIREPW